MNEINRIRQLAGLNPINESLKLSPRDEHERGWIRNAIADIHPEAMSKEELMKRVAQETGYGSNPNYPAIFDQAYNMFHGIYPEEGDAEDETDHSMRQGEMGMMGDDTPDGHRAWDQEKRDWDELADLDQDFNDIEFDELREEIDSLIEEFGCSVNEKAPPGMEDLVLKLKKEYPGEEEKAFATAWSIYNKKNKTDEAMDPWKGYTPDDPKANALAKAPKSTMQGSKVWTFSEMVCDTIEKHGIRDAFQYYVVKHGLPPRMFKIFAAKALYPHKFQKSDSEEQKSMTKDRYAFEAVHSDLDLSELKNIAMNNSLNGYVQFVNIDARNGNPYVSDWFIDGETVVGYENGEEISGAVAEDLNNGYDNVKYACGDDYFPDGADGPVVDKTGPSGARQGDNPEQKKMQIDEVHKELVYSYRQFLEESSDQKKR